MISFLGLARNCASTLPRFFDFLRELNEFGIPSSALIGENGSHDDTPAQLQRAQAEGLVRVVDTAAMAQIPHRLHRMAIGRQILADTWADEELGAAPSFVCVIDLDEVMHRSPSAEAIQEALLALESRDDAFALSATSVPTYYDLLAYEDQERSYAELAHWLDRARGRPAEFIRLHYSTVYPAQRELTSEQPIVAISAFNGLCIYKAEAYGLGSYTLNSDFAVCEHIVFNRSIADATCDFVVVWPGLVVQAPREHVKHGLLRRIVPRLWGR